MKQYMKIGAAAMALILILGTFAACKKDPVVTLSSTEDSSRSAWLEESVAQAEAPTAEATGTEAVKDQPAETEAPAAPDSSASQNGGGQPGGNQNAGKPSGGTQGNTGSQQKPTTTRPTTTQPTTTRPAPPQTTQPTLPVQTELTETQKQAMVDELFNYAKSLGFPTVTKSQLDEDVTFDRWDVTPYNIDMVMNDFKAMLRDYSDFEHTGYTAVTIYWGKEHPNRLCVYTR